MLNVENVYDLWNPEFAETLRAALELTENWWNIDLDKEYDENEEKENEARKLYLRNRRGLTASALRFANDNLLIFTDKPANLRFDWNITDTGTWTFLNVITKAKVEVEYLFTREYLIIKPLHGINCETMQAKYYKGPWLPDGFTYNVLNALFGFTNTRCAEQCTKCDHCNWFCDVDGFPYCKYFDFNVHDDTKACANYITTAQIKMLQLQNQLLGPREFTLPEEQ